MRYLVLFIALTAFSVYAQIYPQMGARSNALGGTGLCFDDTWSVYNNPGAFGAAKTSQIGISYENRMLVKEMSTQTLAFGYHLGERSNIGLHLQHYGFSLYQEVQGGLTYGMQLFDNFSAGVSVNLHRIQLGENYGSKNAFSAALGLSYEMNEQLQFGMRVLNINRAKITEVEDERLPTELALGLQYNFSKKAIWMIEAEKDLLHPVNVKSGIEIQAHEVFAVRVGVNSYPFQSSFGFGLKMKKFHLDMATNWNVNLGLSPSAGLRFNFE